MANRFFPNYPACQVTSPFGMRTLGGTTRMHNGIDLVARTASGGFATDYITAHTGGTVSALGYDASRGNYIQLRCGDAEMVYYHLKDKPGFRVGETVARGQVIGYMGSTGNSTGAHLHFGIQTGGKWIDPAPFLEQDYVPVEEKVNAIGLKTLRSGAICETVRSLQMLLTGRGFPLDADGIFGPNTQAAVVAYQKKVQLEADGIVGIRTWSALLGVG